MIEVKAWVETDLRIAPKTSQVKVGGGIEVGETIWEGKEAIKRDTQVTDGGLKGEARKSMREKWKVKLFKLLSGAKPDELSLRRV